MIGSEIDDVDRHRRDVRVDVAGMIRALAVLGLALAAVAQEPPNIVLIYTDDIGYGDVSCYGATAVATPNVDRLAKEGRRFTDAYCTSATCIRPTRCPGTTEPFSCWRRCRS